MAKEKDATRTRIENIKTELRSVSTCTTTTVTELQELLVWKTSDISQKENIRATHGQPLRAPATGRRKAGAAAAIASVESAQQTTHLLSPRERYILATEAANTTLKCLADALKTQPLAKTSRSPAAAKPAIDTTHKPSKARASHTKSYSVSSRALKERSVSQIVNSPKKPSSLRRSSSFSSFQTTSPDPGLIAIAECARVAFAYLGTPEAIKTAGKDSPPLQLENGILALVGKLVAHGLDNLAVKQMRSLKKRLDVYLSGGSAKHEGRPIICRTGSYQATSAEKESLATLLDFGEVDRTSRALPIITNLQTYALRVIARIKRPQIVEAAWGFLKLSYPSSPANLIWHNAKSSDNQTKVARQLESLAQTLLLLCPSISSSEDENRLQPSPDVVFHLQHLAFKVRQRWWTLAHHKADREKELAEPFTKCMGAFSRRSTLPAAKKYKLAESLWTDLVAAKQAVGPPNSDESYPSTGVNKILSSLAQAAGLSNQALSWLGTEATTTITSDGSATKKTVRSIRVAIVVLEACFKEPPRADINDMITVALENLASGLSGSATELDSLFMEVNALRRMATRILSAQPPMIGESVLESLHPYCIRTIAASILFTARFTGTKTTLEADPNTLGRHQGRLAMATKMARSTLDSVLVCCKRPINSEARWKELDGLIQDCVNLLDSLEKHNQDNARPESSLPEDTQTFAVRLSNAYWSIHLQLQKLGAEPFVAITAMQRSTELLQPRSQTERDTGLLSMKLERLAEALDQLDDTEQSRVAYTLSIQNSLDGKFGQTIGEAVSKHAIEQSFDGSGHLSTLGRTLKSYHRSFITKSVKTSEQLAFFDDHKYAAHIRGAILEWQLALYQKTLSRNRPWDPTFNSSLRYIIQRLLDLYTAAEFPIRRQRVYLTFLQLSQAHPDIVPEAMLQADFRVSQFANVEQTGDLGLARYKDHLGALVNLKLSIREAAPPIAVMRECFLTWERLMNEATCWESLVDRVHNIENWLQEMHMSIDYLNAKGEEYEVLPILHLIIKVLELQGHSDSSDLVSNFCALGLQYLRLGYSGKAGLLLTKAEGLISSTITSTEAKLRWNLGYAEYLLKIGNIAKCGNILSTTETIVTSDPQFAGLAKPSTTLSGRLRFNRILADACYVTSMLSRVTGNHKEAARYARQCVVLNRRIWAALETRGSSRQAIANEFLEAGVDEPKKAAFDPLSSMRNDKGTPLAMSITHDALSGPDFWSLVPHLYRAFMQHSVVFIDQGLFNEAMYAAEQADKVARAVQSSSLLLDNGAHRAEYWAKSGRLDKAQPVLDSLDQTHCGKHLAKLAYYSSTALVRNLNGNLEGELAYYDDMEALLNELTCSTRIKYLESFSPSIESLAIGMSTVSLGDSGPSRARIAKGVKGRQPVGKVAPKVSTKTTSRSTRKATLKSAPTVVSKAKEPATASQTAEKASISEQCSSLYAVRADVTHRRAFTFLLQDDVSRALELLDKAAMLKDSYAWSVSHAWVRFKVTLTQANKSITEDFSFNALPESTIAFPAIPVKSRPSSEGAAAERPTVTKPTTKAGRGKKQTSKDFTESIRSARQHLIEAHAASAITGTSHTFQQISDALSNVTVLLSAMSGANLRGSVHPLYSAYMNELPKCRNLMLSQNSVEIEQEPMSREEYLKWPKPDLQISPLSSVSDFQQSYIDIIPESWTAVSLAINESQDEIYITRYESGISPFVLRLPIGRHSSRDMDEETFSFADGTRELEEIIELSDFSTRCAKDMSSREARLQWWTEREALDTKLHELLLNIENIWFGGFKGVFSQHTRQPALLARFRKSLENILNRHLPSRRKKGQQKTCTLDSRVLDLFLGVGDASNEELDLDDALQDLLYFVVDILQFNGERNAYDEIDFDAMVVETLDAMRAYHIASNNASPAKTHTILILDKKIHMFPWESLPCLENMSISRLPSLAALRERLLAARSSHRASDARPGHYIPAGTEGTSILNPSGDLSHTVKTVQPRLEAMQGKWTHIANRAPTEQEFEDSLKEKDLVLYFGHGSGAQFVRSKNVRRLYLNSHENDGKPGCATTFLFGCSSVHLSDNGIYEPSGMLASYLTAGAPAVVGMLWDVTDKDCDRLAVKAGELWGLWPETEDNTTVEAPQTVKKSKGKGKVAQLVEEVECARGATPGRRGKRNKPDDSMAQKSNRTRESCRGVGLDEAVKEARKACVLRYLNGAAAVVYGIPVYLE